MSIRMLAAELVVCLSSFTGTLAAQSRTLTNADLVPAQRRRACPPEPAQRRRRGIANR